VGCPSGCQARWTVAAGDPLPVCQPTPVWLLLVRRSTHRSGDRPSAPTGHDTISTRTEAPLGRAVWPARRHHPGPTPPLGVATSRPRGPLEARSDPVRPHTAGGGTRLGCRAWRRAKGRYSQCDGHLTASGPRRERPWGGANGLRRTRARPRQVAVGAASVARAPLCSAASLRPRAGHVRVVPFAAVCRRRPAGRQRGRPSWRALERTRAVASRCARRRGRAFWQRAPAPAVARRLRGSRWDRLLRRRWCRRRFADRAQGGGSTRPPVGRGLRGWTPGFVHGLAVAWLWVCRLEAPVATTARTPVGAASR